jgi:hypothetical protein
MPTQDKSPSGRRGRRGPGRPVRAYASIRDFIVKRFVLARAADLANPNWWPCLICDARGGYHKEEDRDCYEGYKLAPWYACGACGGTRQGPKKAVEEVYRTITAQYRADLAAWKEAEGHRQTGLAKLTQEEKVALGL